MTQSHPSGFSIGDIVTFGGRNGQKSRGQVVGTHTHGRPLKKLKIRLLDDSRGRRSKAGDMWGCPPALCQLVSKAKAPTSEKATYPKIIVEFAVNGKLGSERQTYSTTTARGFFDAIDEVKAAFGRSACSFVDVTKSMGAASLFAGQGRAAAVQAVACDIIATVKTYSGETRTWAGTSAAKAVAWGAAQRADSDVNWRTTRYKLNGESITTPALRKLAKAQR